VHLIAVIHMDAQVDLLVTKGTRKRSPTNLIVSPQDSLFSIGTGDVIGVYIHLLAEKPLFMRATKAESSHLDYEMHIDGIKRPG